MNVEERLRTAMHAMSDDLQPDESGGLAVVRTRGRAARRRRALLGAATTSMVVAGLLAVTQLDGRDEGSVTMSTDRPAPVTTGPAITAEPEAPTAPAANPATPTTARSTVPPTQDSSVTDSALVFDQVIWPGPEHLQFDDSVAAARSFVEEFIGRDDPPLGEFRATGTDIGTVDVHFVTESGAVSETTSSTITLQRLQDHWYVTGAVDDDVRIDSPAAHAEVASPVRVEGIAQGYESTVLVEVRDAFSDAGANLGQQVTMGGSYQDPLPFSALVPLTAPAAPTGVIVASTDSGFPGGGSFAAIPVRFLADATESGPPGETTTLRVFLHRVADGQLVEVERTVRHTTGVLRASLVALLDGPTDDERDAGLATWFPQHSGGAVEGVNLDDGLATVQLASRLAEWPLNADNVIAELNATVFQFDNVQVVRYMLDGSCVAFDAWLQRGCEFTRQTQTAAPASSTPCPDAAFNLEELQAAVDEGHLPWVASAPDVAAACTFGQPHAVVEPAGENTFLVTEPSTGNTVLVTVTQPLRPGPTGIWVVTGIDLQGRSIQPAPSGDAPCTTGAVLPVLREQRLFGDVDIIGVDISECQNGYARVIARLDTSACGNDGTCFDEAAQVFLVADNGTWRYFTSGSGIECEIGAVFPPQTLAVLAACEALGLR